MEPKDPLADIFGGWDEGDTSVPAAAVSAATEDPLAEMFGGWDEPEAPKLTHPDDRSMLMRAADALDAEWDGTTTSIQNSTLEDAGDVLANGITRPMKAWLARNTGAATVEEALDNPLETLATFSLRGMADSLDPADIGGMLANEVGVAVLGGGDDVGIGLGYNLLAQAITGSPISELAKKGSAFGDAARWVYAQSGRQWMEPEDLMQLSKENPVEAQAQMRAQGGAIHASLEGLKDLAALPIRVPAMMLAVAEADRPIDAAATVGSAMAAQSLELSGRVAQGNFGGALAQDPVGVGMELLGAGGKVAKLGGAAAAAKLAPKGKAVAAAKAYWSKANRLKAGQAMREASAKAEDILRAAGQDDGSSLGMKAVRTVVGDVRPLVKVMNDNLNPLASAGRAEVDTFRASNLDAASIAARLEDSVAHTLRTVGSETSAAKEVVRRNLQRAPEQTPGSVPFVESHRLASETATPAALKDYLDVARKTKEALDLAPAFAPKNLQRVYSNASDLSRSPDFVTTLRADPAVMKFVDDVTEGAASKLSLRMSESLDPMTVGGKSAASLEGVVQLYDAVESGGSLSKAFDLVKPNPLVAGSEHFVAQQKMFALEVLEPLIRKGELQPGQGMSKLEAVGHMLHSNVTAPAGARALDPLPSLMRLSTEAVTFKLAEELSAKFAKSNPGTSSPVKKIVDGFDISDRLTTAGRTQRNRTQSIGRLMVLENGTRWFQPGANASDWGPLRGKWLNQEVASKFAELSGMTSNSVDKLRGWISRNWVVNNPKSHVSAVAGDLLVLAGNQVRNPVGAMTKWSKAMTGSKGLDAAKIKLARESGVTAGSQLSYLDPDGVAFGQAKLGEGMTFGQSLKAAAEFDFDQGKVGAIANGMTENVYGGLGIFEAMFNAREKAYRMALWDSEYTRLHTNKHGSPPIKASDLDPTLATRASEFALDRGFDYNLAPSGTKIRTGRRDRGINNALTSTVMPFMRYSQAVMQTLGRVAAESSVRPLMNPQLGLRATRAEQALNETIRKQRPDQRNERSTIQIGEMELNAKALNPIASPVTDLLAIAQAESSLDAIPFAKVLSDVYENKGYNGQDIALPGDSKAVAKAKAVEYVFFQMFAPRWSTSLRATARKVGTRDRLGREFSTEEEVIQKFFSMNFDVSKTQLTYMKAQAKRLRKDLKNVRRNAKQEPQDYIKGLQKVRKAHYSRFIHGWPD